jgi:hypothetical protein
MTFQQGLQLATEIFEDKIINLENDYKEKHKEDFNRQKMNKHINRKLKKEINGLIFLNLAYPVKILKNRKI